MPVCGLPLTPSPSHVPSDPYKQGFFCHGMFSDICHGIRPPKLMALPLSRLEKFLAGPQMSPGKTVGGPPNRSRKMPGIRAASPGNFAPNVAGEPAIWPAMFLVPLRRTPGKFMPPPVKSPGKSMGKPANLPAILPAIFQDPPAKTPGNLNPLP